MSSDTPPGLFERFFRASLLLLGGIVALWAACWLLGQFWGWLLLTAGIVLMLWFAVVLYRYWWGRRF